MRFRNNLNYSNIHICKSQNLVSPDTVRAPSIALTTVERSRSFMLCGNQIKFIHVTCMYVRDWSTSVKQISSCVCYLILLAFASGCGNHMTWNKTDTIEVALLYSSWSPQFFSFLFCRSRKAMEATCDFLISNAAYDGNSWNNVDQIQIWIQLDLAPGARSYSGWVVNRLQLKSHHSTCALVCCHNKEQSCATNCGITRLNNCS